MKHISLTTACLASLSFPAFAHEYTEALGRHGVSAELVMELQNEYTPHADDASRDDYNNIFFRSELAVTAELSKHFFIDGVAVFENIQDIRPNRSNAFDNEGVFIEDIKLNYVNGPAALFAGKFNPAFGIAWDFGRGIWTEDFAEDYETTEKIGFGGAYTFTPKGLGSHTFIASTFFADTSPLSGSLITKRDQLNRNDGGTSNTEDFSSFTLALEGENLAGVENLYYKLGYRHQAEGNASTGGDDEKGYVVTLGHVFPLSDAVSMDALIEYTDIQNFDTSLEDRRYLSASLITTLDEKWRLTLGYTGRNIDSTTSTDADDHLIEISTGYNFGQGTTAEIGWRNTEESNANTDIIGGLIRHTITF